MSSADGTATERAVPEQALTEGAALEKALERYASYRAGRERTIRGASGPLALEATLWVVEADRVFEIVPGRWSPRADGARGVVLTAEAGDGILLDGDPVDGTVTLVGPGAITPSDVRLVDGRTITVIDNGMPYSAIRVWNAEAEAIADFARIDAYDYDPALVVEAAVTRHDDLELDILHVRDGAARPETIGAEFTFELDGVAHTFAGITESHGFLVSFADATTGTETYGVGRFLMLSPRADGTVTIDFNRAYLPPCAFSIGFNCPIPPEQNRLGTAIRAGEKQAIAANGEVFRQSGVFA